MGAEVPWRHGDEGGGLGPGARGCRAADPEHRCEFAEVAGRLDDVEELLGPVGSFSHEFDGTRFHDVDELAGITLAEQYLAGVERDLLGWPDDRSGAGVSSTTWSAIGSSRSSCVATITARPGAANSRRM